MKYRCPKCHCKTFRTYTTNQFTIDGDTLDIEQDFDDSDYGNLFLDDDTNFECADCGWEKKKKKAEVKQKKKGKNKKKKIENTLICTRCGATPFGDEPALYVLCEICKEVYLDAYPNGWTCNFCGDSYHGKFPVECEDGTVCQECKEESDYCKECKDRKCEKRKL
jgi:hypothetical protein